MGKNEKLLTYLWGSIVALLIGVCVYEYSSLSYNLMSVYDEGYFYTHVVYAHQTVVSTEPLSLATYVLNALIPNIKQCDVLALRQISFCSKLCALLFLILVSVYYTYRRFEEKRLWPYLTLVASLLLLGSWKLPSIAFSWDDAVFVLLALIFSTCLMLSVAIKSWEKYGLYLLIGILSLLLLLCNLPAGCGVIVLSFVFLICDNGFQARKSVPIVCFCGVGMFLGVIVVHFFIINMHDIYAFFIENFLHTINQNDHSSHSLMKVILVIFFGIRDLIITTLLLCGITWSAMEFRRMINRDWFVVIVILVLFFIVWKWQMKPTIYFSSVICWFTIMFMVYHWRTLDMRDILLILFCFFLPLVACFGTNTTILRKAMHCSVSWGMLLFYMLYRSQSEIRKYAMCGFAIAIYAVVSSYDIPLAKKQMNSYLEQKTPISRMHLNNNQKVFYDEVYKVLSNNGYEIGKDTMLGFCFNEMTVVAMGATPYTNDAYPHEFLLHDLSNVPIANYIILSEYDSIMLSNRLTELDWDFPEGYTYYKCTNHPDPELKTQYKNTQSMIYCKKRISEND